MAEPPKPAAWREGWKRHRLALLLLWGLTLLAYSNSFRAELIFDSQIAVARDPRVRAVTSDNISKILNQGYWYRFSTTGLYRPLTTFSYLFNYAVLGNGTRPGGYHVLNLALHMINVALLYFLAFLIMEGTWPALAAAAIWAVHPILTESVTNIVGRADLIAGLAVLGGLLCHIASTTTTGWRRAVWLRALLVITAVGLLSKENAIVLLAVIPLYDLAFRPNATWRSRFASYTSVALPVVGFLVLRSSVLAKLATPLNPFGDNPLVGADFWTSRLTAMKVLGKYVGLLLWPAQLSCDYSFNQIPLFAWKFNSWEEWKTVLGVALCVGAAAVALLCYRRAKPAFFFLLFSFIAMAPTANLFMLIGTIMAERLFYLPAAGLVCCLVWAAHKGYQRLDPQGQVARFVVPAALVLVCGALGARTFARNLDWRDETSLWSSAVKAAPGSYKTHLHMAGVFLASESIGPDPARVEVEKSLRIIQPLRDADSISAVHADAGKIDRVKGDLIALRAGKLTEPPAESFVWYRKALAILLRGKEIDKAIDQELKSRNTADNKWLGDTGWPYVYLELGRTYGRLGEWQQALDAFQFGRKIEQQTVFFEEMSAAYRSLGDPEKAVISLLEAITMDTPDQPRLAGEVVELYRQTMPDSCAVTGSGASIALNFECPMVHQHLCTAARNVMLLYAERGRTLDVIATRRSAVRSLGCPAEQFR